MYIYIYTRRLHIYSAHVGWATFEENREDRNEEEEEIKSKLKDRGGSTTESIDSTVQVKKGGGVHRAGRFTAPQFAPRQFVGLGRWTANRISELIALLDAAGVRTANNRKSTD